MSIIDFPSQGSIGTSLKPKRMDIELYQGDSFDVSIEFKQANGDPVDLTGVTANVKFVAAGAGPTPPSQPVVDIDELTGIVNINIEDTSGFSGEYNWDLQLVQGTKKRTYVGGVVTVTEDITP
jgi:hypothetical protein